MDSTNKLMTGVIDNIHRIGGVNDESFSAIQAVHVAFALSRSMSKQAAIDQLAACWDQYAAKAEQLLVQTRGGIN